MQTLKITCSSILLVALASAALALPPISYQGELRDNGELFEGTASFKFAIIADGATLWSNDGTGTGAGAAEPPGSVEVPVTAGIFSVLLGDEGMAPLAEDLLGGVSDPQLRIWVDTGSGFEQLSDQPIASGAYALHSHSSERAPNGFDVEGELQVSGAIRVGSAGIEFFDGSVQTTSASGEPSGPAGGDLVGQYPDPGIAANKVVKSLNGFRDNVTLAAGDNVALDEENGTITIHSTASGGEGGVPSINGITGPVTMVGAGGAVVDTDGETITITAAVGEGAAGVQGVQSGAGTIKVSDPVGPTVTLDVAPGAIGETHLAGNAVTSAKIDDATIRNQDIAPNAAIAESKLALGFRTHSNANDPTSAQKAALAGVGGAPSGSNRYVTDNDRRLDDSRRPFGAAGGDLDGTYPNPTIAAGKAVTSLNNAADDVTLVGGSNVTVSTRGNQISISATGGGESGPFDELGIGIDTPRATLDVRATDLDLPTEDLHNEAVIVEGNNAILGLYSQGIAAGSAPGIVLGRTVFGSTSKWALFRNSATEGGLLITSGNNANFALNKRIAEFTEGGGFGPRLGIGAFPALASLHVSSGESGDAEMILEADTDNNNESDNAFITFRQDGGAVNAFVGLEGNASSRSPGTLNNALVIGSEDDDPPIQFITDDKLRMTIRETGLIGVGLNFPLQEFHVEGDIAVTGTARVGIGTTNPQANLEVFGDIAVSGNGQVGIGTTSPEADLDVRGDVKWSPVTSYIMIHPAALLAQDNSPLPKYSISASKGLHCLADASPPAFDDYTFLAPVSFPDRARVSSFVLYHVDNESDTNFSAKLVRRDLTGGTTTTMGQVTTSGSSSSVETASDTSISGLDVDNSKYAYYVSVTITEALEHYVTALRIKYTTEGPY